MRNAQKASFALDGNNVSSEEKKWKRLLADEMEGKTPTKEREGKGRSEGTAHSRVLASSYPSSC